MQRFSIILPVRNGGEYIKECVKSILSQSCADFNLLILDNNSTDGTLQWIESVQDKRIIIFPSQKSLSIEENWARITTIPKNEFITLIGHDDILYKEYLETMNALIEMYPDASLYQTHFNYIDANGAVIRKCKPMVAKEKAEVFLHKFLVKEIDVMGTGFMMRSKDYDILGGIPPKYPNLLFADFELWIKLCAINYKATSKKEAFAFRVHQSTTTVSPDLKFQLAFRQFVYFLNRLQKDKNSFDEVVKQSTASFLSFYCKSLSHRLLRTPRNMRSDLSVGKFIDDCKGYALLLELGESFNPNKIFSLLIARAIDSNVVSRYLFLTFKRFFPKPILR